MRYIILGNGIAGTTVARILDQKSNKDDVILQFSDEPWGYYPRPKLPHFLEDSKITPDDLIIYNKDWYKTSKIDMHLDEKIQKINAKTKEVFSDKGVYQYDRLLLALGAHCACPPIPGMDLKHSYELRTLSDAIKIRKRLETSKSVVIIGGGILGIENAISCAKRGIETTIIEYYGQLLPRQLDQEGSEVFTELLSDFGVRTVLTGEVEKILGEEEVQGVQLKDGRVISADLTMSCTGIKPRVKLATNTGLKINRGVIVNDYLETSEPDIYAAGDMVEHNNKVYGIIPPTTDQARIAALNMINPRSQQYHGSKISTTLKVADLYLTSIGYEFKQPKYSFMKHIDQDKHEYVKLYHKDDYLKAAIILGTKRGIPLIRKLFDNAISDNLNQLEEIFPGISS